MTHRTAGTSRFPGCAVVLLLWAFPGFPSGFASESPDYVGVRACETCHATETNAWRGSHHDLAMQTADERSVLGDFADATFERHGITTTFFKRDGKFMVRTEGPDGALHEYPIPYTFGFDPLQQYLVAFPGGRYQALTVAWDSRPSASGGQRWFHLYPDARFAPGDPLHWTGIEHNWNARCAACHSTNLRRNYDADKDAYATTWSEIDVACEACHGPGSRHVAWAKTGSPADDDKGLLVDFDARDRVRWPIDPATGNARRVPPASNRTELDTCAMCHSRRARIWSEATPGAPLLDAFLPSLLRRGLYHADGQILDEVYVYGSFIQSRMHRAGVSCSDCHDPHSLELRAPGNGVCLQCHLADKYDSSEHHFHPRESAGAACVGCHMPARTYMVVDPRRDHSLRIPRPDRSLHFATPNACNACHVDRNAKWALDQVKRWYGDELHGFQRYTRALAAARAGTKRAAQLLAALADDTTAPEIARATALAELGSHLSPITVDTLRRGLGADDARMRVAAVDALESLAPTARPPLLLPLLDDPVRAVRIQAAARLAAVPANDLADTDRARIARGIEEYVAAQRVNADRPEANLNLGIVYMDLRQLDKAERWYRRALDRQASFVPAYVNLAELYRQQGRDADGEAVLRSGLKTIPDAAGLHHALGLTLVRRRQLAAALESLERAATLDPGDARYGYVYGVALASAGRSKDALAVLERVHRRHPGDRAVLVALVNYHEGAGNRDAAVAFARRLLALDPSDPGARALMQQLSPASQ